jgi:hypothetical protein
MKTLILTSIIALMTLFGNTVRAEEWPEEYLGLPGDNLNLYAVMKLFQESETLEGFERSLNDENSRINNHDLNGDHYVDYIMVFDYVDGNVHTIVLRVALNKYENQDVAVFTVERFNDGSVQVQLIGDEALYGRNYIVEPIYAEYGNETPNPAYIGNARTVRNTTVIRTTTYEVAAWPLIRFIYLPTYISWRSSWYWGHYPVYWSVWRPYYWHYYYGYHSRWYPHYYSYYRHWRHPRCVKYHNHYYSSVRVFSPHVTININKGNYRHTYSRPDLRERGEALYARTNTGRNEINRGRSSANSSVRAASTSAARVSERSAASSARRSSTKVSSRSASGRSSTAVGDRTATSARRASPAVSSRSTTERSSTAVSKRAAPSTGRAPAAVSSSTFGSENRSSTAVQRSNDLRSSPSVSTRSSATRSTTSVRKEAAPQRPAVNTASPATRSTSSVRQTAPVRKSSPAPSVKSGSSPSRSSNSSVRSASSSRSSSPDVKSASKSSRSSNSSSKSASSSSRSARSSARR